MPGRTPRVNDVVRTGLGSALATAGATSIVLSLALGWSELPRPWSFLIGLAGGLAAGGGCALALCGLARLRPWANGREADRTQRDV
jgi:hypothetical protein